MGAKKGNEQLYLLSKGPRYEKLPWPGLKAKDSMSRVVTRALKEAKEERERNLWAERQIARVLDNVPPRAAISLVFREMSRRGRPMPRLAKALLELLPG
jgi:hypothetical protein